MERTPEEIWPPLAPGTQVGDWRVEARYGQGAYGAVYRAVRAGQEHSGPVALKLALYPWDARFDREAQLLSRLHHPSIPRLLDRGVMRHCSGVEHSWLVMEWVEGTPLYVWARQHTPSHRQVCLLLAQLARALEAVHAAGAVHRDVKGDNVLVRLLDRRAVLVDFGSCHFQGATRLTWRSLPPGTFAYQSAQACLFHLRSVREPDSYYPPSPADDLYALGVTAYRLAMGEYPPPIKPHQDAQGAWYVASPDPRPLLEKNPRVHPLLRELILRLLSDAPEVRGTAAQAAAALESAADERMTVLPPASQPVTEPIPPSAPAPTVGSVLSPRPSPPSPGWNWRPWLALAATGGCAVLLWRVQPVSVPSMPLFESARQASSAQSPDAGTSAMGDSSPAEPQASDQHPSREEPPGQQPPREPHPQQARPDAKGRCPGHKQVVINGGCWVEFPSMSPKDCEENGYVLLAGKCYASALEPPRRRPPPTSSPAKAH